MFITQSILLNPKKLMSEFLIVAQRSAANSWLDDNPLVLGLIFLALGGVLMWSGIRELKTGVAKDKYGNDITGGLGKAISLIRVVIGAGLCIFAVYKAVTGMMG